MLSCEVTVEKVRGTLKAWLALWVGLLLTGCASLQPQDFAGSQTRFELDRYFEGQSKSWGVFENAGGTPKRYFTCDSYGRRNHAGDVVLSQKFHFNDGKTQTRVWHIHRIDPTHWEATANDMIGSAHGTGIGNAFSWEYDITVDRSNPLATVHIRQWLYQAEGTTDVLSRLVITKLGIKFFEVSEVIHKVPSNAGR